MESAFQAGKSAHGRLLRRCRGLRTSDELDTSQVARLCGHAQHVQRLDRELVFDSMWTDLGVAAERYFNDLQ